MYNLEDKPKIVFVDDEVSILTNIKSLLRRKYTVYTFSNPLEVEDFIATNPVDLIISDEMMPDMKGSELVARLDKLDPDLIKIILSGHSDKENMANAINNGHIFSFLFKPVNNIQLIQVIEKGLENKKMKDEIKTKSELLKINNKKLEEMVEKRTKQVISMEKFFEIGKFSASIVHNLNNPLQALVMASQLIEMDLRTKKDDEEFKDITKYLQMIDENLLIMEKMIKSITSSVRSVESDKDIELSVNDILKKAIEFMRIDHDFKHKIDVEFKLSPQLPKLLGKEVHFLQIFSNLFKNATDAMDNCETKKICVETFFEGNVLQIHISDTGTGIKEDDLHKIFSTDFTTKAPGKGTGLGLPITKQMVEAYKGELKVESVFGQGTKFLIEIPVE